VHLGLKLPACIDLQQCPQRTAQNENSTSAFKRGHILNEDEVDALRADIQNMTTPSWLTSIPGNLGQPSHGKLKADQWRTLGTVYLPISLIRLWEKVVPNSDRSSRCHKMLITTLHLISAVIIASLRSTSREKAKLYLHHMSEYLKGIRELIPDYKFRPNHHMALHLWEYLCLYGPVHSWWTFPFERLIGLLQRLPTNFKPGKCGPYRALHHILIIFIVKDNLKKPSHTLL